MDGWVDGRVGRRLGRWVDGSGYLFGCGQVEGIIVVLFISYSTHIYFLSCCLYDILFKNIANTCNTFESIAATRNSVLYISKYIANASQTQPCYTATRNIPCFAPIQVNIK